MTKPEDGLMDRMPPGLCVAQAPEPGPEGPFPVRVQVTLRCKPMRAYLEGPLEDMEVVAATKALLFLLPTALVPGTPHCGPHTLPSYSARA